MRILVSGATKTMPEMARAYPKELGTLLTPASGNSIESVTRLELPWAADNSAFSNFDEKQFKRMLRLVRGVEGLLWITCPDVVGNAVETMRRFRKWYTLVARAGPVAFVAQDGVDPHSIPWDDIDCLFIGGTTSFKVGSQGYLLARWAKKKGKLLHIGRVNTHKRLLMAWQLEADSVDGSGYSRFAELKIPPACQYIQWLRNRNSFQC